MAKEFEPKKIILDLGLGPDGKTTKFITNTVAKRMDKYVPARSLTLASTVQTTDNQIIYDQEYADYVYKGVSKLGKPMRYTRTMHRGAGPYWDLRMMTAEKSSLIKEIQNYIDRGA